MTAFFSAKSDEKINGMTYDQVQELCVEVDSYLSNLEGFEGVGEDLFDEFSFLLESNGHECEDGVNAETLDEAIEQLRLNEQIEDSLVSKISEAVDFCANRR